MDIVFDCPNCSQELAVDSSGAGTDIECPSCGEMITIPPASTKVSSTAPGEVLVPNLTASPITASAAAKVEKHLKVPVRTTPGEKLIAKPKPPLGAKTPNEKQISARTIRHAQCVESGHDKFDEVVTQFLTEMGESKIIGVHTISYSYFDVGTQKMITDYGVMVIYRG
jgi:DNA-directed RNA polymerase subunit RPC12/RpoP